MEKKIEYRSNRGNRRLVAGVDGRVVPSLATMVTGEELRMMGCPEHLIAKHEARAAAKRAAASVADIKQRAAAAMAKGAPEVKPLPSFEDLRARSVKIADQIADDNKRLREQEELKQRMRRAAGIVHAR